MRAAIVTTILFGVIGLWPTTAPAQFEERSGDRFIPNPKGAVDILRLNGVLTRAEEELGPVFYDRRERGYYVGRAGDRYETIACTDAANRSVRTCTFLRWRRSLVTNH
jgi:hypothetical protein